MAKECIQHGCTKLVKKGSRCDEHSYQKMYKANRTDVNEQRFYTSTEWKKVRDMSMHRHMYLCVRCKQPAVYVDHIVPLKVHWDRRLDPTNLQPLCPSCHKQKGIEDDRDYNIKSNVGDNVVRKAEVKGKRQSLNDFWSSGDALK